MNMRSRFSKLIKSAFEDDPRFVEALDKACETVLNARLERKHPPVRPCLLRAEVEKEGVMFFL